MAPASARACAIVLPMPLPPPVTRAHFPERLKSSMAFIRIHAIEVPARSIRLRRMTRFATRTRQPALNC